METYTGVVGRVFNRGKMWSLNCGDEWYGCGYNKPDCVDGQTVSFNWDSNEGKDGRVYKNVIKGSLKVDSNAAPAKASTPTPASRDVSIQYQSSRKDAIAVLPILLEAGGIPLPSKQADKHDAILAIINDLTNKFYLDIQATVDNGGVDVEDMVATPEDFE